MQMNSGIILAGQPVNALESYMGGQQAGQQRIEWDRQNALAKLYRDQGAGIVAGDPNALNALAGMDPQAAMQMQTQQQGLAMDQERLQMARAAAAREAEAWAGQTDAAKIAAERDRLANGLKGASFFYSQGDRKGYEAFLAQQGLDPAQVPFDQFPAFAAGAEGVLEVLQGFTPAPQTAANVTKGAGEGKMWIDPNDPTKGVTDIPGAAQPQAFRNATPEEAAQYGAAAGQFGPDGRFYPINPPSGMTVRTNPDGTMEMVQGPMGGAPKLSEQQSKDLVYYQRATGASQTLDAFEKPLTDLAQRGAGAVPMVGNMMTSPEFQQGQQAASEWLAAILRKDTGAAITKQEFDLYTPMYIPMPGDSPAVLEQKRTARKRAEEAIKLGLGTATPLIEDAAPTTPPEGVEPAIWDAMTPEEKALFQ